MSRKPIKRAGPPKSAATTDQAAEEAAADQREVEAFRRFFGHILGDTLRPSCRRLGSSQRGRGKPKKGPGK